jgi:hypothetical protein
MSQMHANVPATHNGELRTGHGPNGGEWFHLKMGDGSVWKGAIYPKGGDWRIHIFTTGPTNRYQQNQIKILFK